MSKVMGAIVVAVLYKLGLFFLILDCKDASSICSLITAPYVHTIFDNLRTLLFDSLYTLFYKWGALLSFLSSIVIVL